MGKLSAAMKAKRDAGVDPSDPEVRALVERLASLTERTIAGFTGGDPGIASSLGRMDQEEGPGKSSCAPSSSSGVLTAATVSVRKRP